MSPRCRPARSAELPGATSVTTTPCENDRPRSVAGSVVSGSTASPQMASLRAAAVTGSSAGISPTATVTGSRASLRTTTTVTDCPGDTALKLGHLVDGLARELHHHVARPDAGGLGRSPLHDVGDEHAL